VRWYSTSGAVEREDWYITAEEAEGCLARDYRGRLGPWRPLAPDADPLRLLADAPPPETSGGGAA
jgi:hypothetical protein